MEAYLEVTEENVADLTELGFKAVVGEELTCEVEYDKCPADPSVGIDYGYCEVTSVTCEGKDMDAFFDFDKLGYMAEQEVLDQREDSWRY